MTAPTLSREEIDGLKALLEKASLPWRVESNRVYDIGGKMVTAVDTPLAAAAVNALPALLAEIEAGRAGAERVRAATVDLEEAQHTIQEQSAQIDTLLFRLDAEEGQATGWECKDYADGWIKFDNARDAKAYQAETGCLLRVTYMALPAGFATLRQAAQPAGRVEALIEAVRKWQSITPSRTASRDFALEAAWDAYEPPESASPAPSGDGEGGGDG